MKQFLKIVLAAALILAGVPQAAKADFLIGSAAAVSGDTLIVTGPGQRAVTVRLWGIQAPAVSGPNEAGLYARTALDDLLRTHGPSVRCTLDTVDRNAAVCHAGTVDLGEAMLLSGWGVTDRAVTLSDAPGISPDRARRAELYHKAETSARAARRGRWAGMPGQ